jgi:DNA-directed RNA polymerase beta' subunit
MIVESEWSVTSAEIYLRGKDNFHPLGILSEQIFGPLKDFQCQCGQLQGMIHVGKRCPDCNVLVGSSTLRRYIVSRIQSSSARLLIPSASFSSNGNPI